ncbi:MAG: Putative activity regulator of membrane protease YbbK [Nitrospira sp.]|jgi:membrane protein implicated in regulation of membrane protease activity|nr:MAG: Putative activity regulator of membrane protease YbbK [Nitrospira sp.]
MTWWLWALFGLFLLGGEVVTPGGFYMLFFGIGALVVGLLVGLGLIEAGWISWLLFSVISVASLVILRPPLRRLMSANLGGLSPMDTMVGETALALDDLTPGTLGKAECRGSIWNARNGSDRSLSKGQRSRVDRVDGITLWITPE